MARILVVEDEPLIAMMLGDWLEELGHQAIGPAATVGSAIDLAVSGSPDYALVDVNLAGTRSDPVAEVLISRDVPFAFATGSAADGMIHLYPSVPTLSKPYDFEALRSVLERLQRSSRSPAASEIADLPNSAG
jgi:CheY-like chemotaxis protein